MVLAAGVAGVVGVAEIGDGVVGTRMYGTVGVGGVGV